MRRVVFRQEATQSGPKTVAGFEDTVGNRNLLYQL